MADTYKVERLYFNSPGQRRVIKSGLTLEQAQEHCRDPETSSRTAKGLTGKRRTRQLGPWFDSYTEE